MARMIDPAIRLIRQGASPEKIALSLAWGVTLGIFPVLGLTTALCFAAAFLFRLNLAAIQLANWAVYPLQIVLLVPFFAAGGWLFGLDPLLHSAPGLASLSAMDMGKIAGLLGSSTGKAVLAWCIVAPFLTAALYGIVAPLLRKLMHSRESGQG